MKLDENVFFRQAALSLFSSLDIETSTQCCLDYLQSHIPASGLVLDLYDPELNVRKVLASLWPPDMQKPSDTISLPMEFWSYFKNRFVTDSGIRVVNDIDKEDAPIQQIMSIIWPADVSVLIMTLSLEHTYLGDLVLFAPGKHRYTDRHCYLLSLLHELFTAAIANILQHNEIKRLNDMLVDQNRYLHREMLRISGNEIIGARFGLQQVMQLVGQVAPLDSPVLLMGETGVGKEVITNAIHNGSLRQDNPLIKVNCGAIPESLIDSELFGHEKGAFTGATARKLGHFERANKGTIFLDEVGELPFPAQVRLLRVLQQKEIVRVGGTKSIPVDVRVISATNRNLEDMVQRGQFRQDLWFRLNVFPIVIPPLRQRIEDISALVTHFLSEKAKELKIQTIPTLAPGSIELLQSYEWPGNVREMENLIERALILSQSQEGDGLLHFDHLIAPSHAMKTKELPELHQKIVPLDEIVTAHIRAALTQTKGQVEGENGAARLLGLHPSTLRGRMRKLGIQHGRKG